jgi:hypothetical protein
MIRFSKDFHKINEYFFMNEEGILESGRESNMASNRNTIEDNFSEVKKKAILPKKEIRVNGYEEKPFQSRNQDISVYKSNNLNETFYSIVDEEEEPLKVISPKLNKAVTFGLNPEVITITKISKPKFFDPIYESKRLQLPVLKKQMNLNVWSILKDAVGKDLSKFCVPGIYIIIK